MNPLTGAQSILDTQPQRGQPRSAPGHFRATECSLPFQRLRRIRRTCSRSTAIARWQGMNTGAKKFNCPLIALVEGIEMAYSGGRR